MIGHRGAWMGLLAAAVLGAASRAGSGPPLPDLKIQGAHRTGPGKYEFKVKNVGHAPAPPYRVAYYLNPGPPGYVYVKPDPAPGLAPGQSYTFVVTDVSEEAVKDPKKDRVDVHLHADHDNAIPEEDEENNWATTGYGSKGPWGERLF